MSRRRFLKVTVRRFRRPFVFGLCLTLIAGPANACGDETAEACFERALGLRNTGQANAAVPLLRSVLAQRPGLLRVKAELATTLLAVDDLEAARGFVSEVLAAPDLPAPVRLNLQRLQARIEARERALSQHTGSAQALSFGLGYGDRLDFASGEFSISDGSPVQNSLRDERGAAYTQIGWNRRWRERIKPGVDWRLAVAATTRRNLGDSAFDLDSIALRPGQRRRVGRNAVLDVTLLTHRLYRGGGSFLRETGAIAQLAQPAVRNGEEWMAGIDWLSRRHTRFEQQYFDGDSWRLWGAYGNAVSGSPHWRWAVQAELGAWDAPFAASDYRSLRLSTALIFSSGAHRTVLGLEQRYLDFAESSISFPATAMPDNSLLEEPDLESFTRSDGNRYVRLSYHYRWSPTWRIQLSWLHTQGEASVVEQGTRREVVDLKLIMRLP